MESVSKTLKKDFFLFNNEVFTKEDQNILQNTIPELIAIKTSNHSFKINSRYLENPEKNKFPVFMLHGHGSTCTWATWIKLGSKLFKDGYSVVLIDLPGYGESKMDDRERVNPKL